VSVSRGVGSVSVCVLRDCFWLLPSATAADARTPAPSPTPPFLQPQRSAHIIIVIALLLLVVLLIVGSRRIALQSQCGARIGVERSTAAPMLHGYACVHACGASPPPAPHVHSPRSARLQARHLPLRSPHHPVGSREGLGERRVGSQAGVVVDRLRAAVRAAADHQQLLIGSQAVPGAAKRCSNTTATLRTSSSSSSSAPPSSYGFAVLGCGVGVGGDHSVSRLRQIPRHPQQASAASACHTHATRSVPAADRSSMLIRCCGGLLLRAVAAHIRTTTPHHHHHDHPLGPCLIPPPPRFVKLTSSSPSSSSSARSSHSGRCCSSRSVIIAADCC